MEEQEKKQKQEQEKKQKPQKIGFFEEYDPESGMIQKKMAKIIMPFAAAFTGFFAYQSFIVEGNSITANSLVLVLIFLVATFSPEFIKDIAKKKIK